MYEDRTQNYDSEIHEEYLMHDSPTSFIAMCRLNHNYKHNYLDCIFCCNCDYDIWIFNVSLKKLDFRGF